MNENEIEGRRSVRGTTAQRMLDTAVREKQRLSGETQREIASKLGYKSSVVLSHMSTGRVPIPVDKALPIADELGLDRNAFLLAVLEQRYADIDFRQFMSVTFSSDRVTARLEAVAGSSLDDIPSETVSILEEVVAARLPKRRWLTVAEVQVMDLIRRLRPEVSVDGLDEAECYVIEEALSHL